MDQSERTFGAIQRALVGASIEDVAAEFSVHPRQLVDELRDEFVAHGLDPDRLEVFAEPLRDAHDQTGERRLDRG